MKKYIWVILTGIILISSCTSSNKKIEVDENKLTEAGSDTVLIAFNERIKKNPNDPEVYHERAIYYFEKKNDVEAAFADMRRVFAIDTTTSKYFVTLADLYLAKGMSGNVKASLNKAIENDPKNIIAYTKLAELNLYIKDYNACLKSANDVLKIDIYNPRAYFIKGMAYKELGDTAKAISSFQTVIEQDPEYYNAYMQLGILFAALKNPLALDYLNNALNLQPQSIEAYYAMGMFFQETGNINKAIEVYNTILKIDSTYNDAHFNLGYIAMVMQNDMVKAIKHFSDNIKFHPNNYEAFYMRGLCYERIKDKVNAARDYQQALKLYPQYDDAAIALGNLIDK
ncbi:MAG: tetratricopeptide repeat protein [Bacteroidia bacterium]